MKTHSLILILALIAVMAGCKQQVHPVAEVAQTTQVPPTSSPTVVDDHEQEKVPVVPERGEEPESINEEEPPPEIQVPDNITPETKLYFAIPRQEEAEKGIVKSYFKPVCESAIRAKRRFPILEACEFSPEIVALVRIGEMKYQNKCLKMEERFTGYPSMNIMDLDILHVFAGELKQKHLKRVILSAYGEKHAVSGFLRFMKKGELAIMGLIRAKSGEYFAMRSVRVSLKNDIKPYKFVAWIPDICEGVDLPDRVGKIDATFQKLVSDYEKECPDAGFDPHSEYSRYEGKFSEFKKEFESSLAEYRGKKGKYCKYLSSYEREELEAQRAEKERKEARKKFIEDACRKGACVKQKDGTIAIDDSKL